MITYLLSHVLPSISLLFAAGVGPGRELYAIPLITSVSLVYAATRHEQMGPILNHALRFGLWIVVFMVIVLIVIQGLSWLA
jgi:TRAP-type C4-dicarboxylate transport system permease large subunit